MMRGSLKQDVAHRCMFYEFKPFLHSFFDIKLEKLLRKVCHLFQVERIKLFVSGIHMRDVITKLLAAMSIKCRIFTLCSYLLKNN